MAPGSIQFAHAADGIAIPYWSIGSGPPIVLIHNFTASHVELDWEVGSFQAFYLALAEHHQVIRVDARGMGLSSVKAEPSVDEIVGDVLAVADALGHDRFALIATSTMAPVGLSLGSTDRLSHLILCDPTVVMAEATEHLRYIRATEAMAAAGASDLAAHFWISIATPEDAVPLAALVEENVRRHPAVMTGVMWDGRPLLGDVIAPTLIAYSRPGRLTSVDQVHEAAASIPNARLVAVEGMLCPYLVDPTQMLTALGDFLGWESRPAPEAGPTTSVIVFTDVVASTEVVDRFGDERGRAALRSVEDIVTETAGRNGGTVVKHLGDGSLLEFRSASNALDFAARVQQALADGDIGLRIGMAAGEPIREEGDLHGAVVVVASRVTDSASAGEVVVSAGVRHLVVGKQYEFDDLGDLDLKGFEKPVGIWRLRG